MDLILNTLLAKNFKNNSQKIRIISESWVLNQIYCPSCGNGLSNYDNNKPVADFYCVKCAEDFELKSKSGKFTNSISAGAYSKMLERISSQEKPNFFFMEYLSKLWSVDDFFVVPKHFIVKEIIQQRKPLSEKAKRAGWIGSNIIFSKIPKAGQIFYIEKGVVIPRFEVLKKWQKTVFLKYIINSSAKGWIIDVMNCIDSINKMEFTLKDIYDFESDLKKLHPENNHVKDKIRQQLQFLRNKNYLEFLGNGNYKLK